MNDFDTNWFKLENYDNLKNFDLRAWHDHLEIRLIFNYRYHEWIELNKIKLGQLPILEMDIDFLKKSPARNLDPLSSSARPRRYPTVFSTPAMYIWEQVRDGRLADVWKSCDSILPLVEYENYPCDRDNKRIFVYRSNLEKFIYTPVDELLMKAEIGHKSIANVTVDLNATDVQLEEDFRNWLKYYRKEIDYLTVNKAKLFTETDMHSWRNDCLLPYIDLSLIAMYERKKLTSTIAGSLLFKNMDSEAASSRIRKSTHPKSEDLMNNKFNAIKAQVSTREACVHWGKPPKFGDEI